MKRSIFKTASLALLGALLTISFLSACKNSRVKPTPIHGSWYLGDAQSLSANREERMSSTQRALSVRLLQKGYAIHFFSDSTFTELLGFKYRSGVWRQQDEQVVVLTPEETGSEEVFRIIERVNEQMAVSKVWEASDMQWTMVRVGRALNRPENDPFHPSLNEWRRKPAQSETDAQLRARLLNHLRHNVAILEAGEARDTRVFSWRFTPTCVQIYNGGVGFKSEADIEPEFYDCFYSIEDARRCIALYVDELRKGGSIGYGTGNWVRDDANLLNLMIERMVQSPL